MDYSIEAIRVEKSYGKKKVLKKVSLSVEKGTVFALLGPNGAGKTSFVKTLLDIVPLSSGTIKINGKDSHLKEARKGVRFLQEKFSFFPYFTVSSTVYFYGGMCGLKGEELKKEVQTALEKLSIADLYNTRIKALSKGQLQRVGLATLLVKEGDLFILDEPFTGLDPIGIKDLKNIIFSLKEKKKTIFINSHILSEIEQVCDSIAILNKGECLFQGSLETLPNGVNLEDFFYQKVVNK